MSRYLAIRLSANNAPGTLSSLPRLSTFLTSLPTSIVTSRCQRLPTHLLLRQSLVFRRRRFAAVACVAPSERVITLVDIPTKHQILVVPPAPRLQTTAASPRHTLQRLVASASGPRSFISPPFEDEAKPAARSRCGHVIGCQRHRRL